MLAEPQRICFERARRETFGREGRPWRGKCTWTKNITTNKNVTTDYKCHNRFENRSNSFASLGEAECFITPV